MSDRLMYQDDYIKNDFYNMYLKYDITDGRLSNHTEFTLSDEKYTPKDAVNLIVTQGS